MDLIAGFTGGIAQVLLGQPFDIVKVRLQTSSSPNSSALATAKDILKNEGPLAFYKGSLAPLLGIGACVAVQFSAFHSTRRFLEERNGGALSLPQIYLAGAAAGIANSPLSTPIEHVRIRLQANPGRSGPAECVKMLLSKGGLFRGFPVTVAREIQAYGVWFATFEALMRRHTQRLPSKERSDIPTPYVALYGGIAGEALWLSSYPLDVIKTRMQTDGFGADRKYQSAVACARSVFQEGGIAAFWRGIGTTMARAAPVSAGTFAVAEMTLRFLGAR